MIEDFEITTIICNANDIDLLLPKKAVCVNLDFDKEWNSKFLKETEWKPTPYPLSQIEHFLSSTII